MGQSGEVGISERTVWCREVAGLCKDHAREGQWCGWVGGDSGGPCGSGRWQSSSQDRVR
jgi:hypothetical protein